MTGPRQRSLGQLVSLTPASAAPKATRAGVSRVRPGTDLQRLRLPYPSLHTRPDARAHPMTSAHPIDPSVKRQVISSRYRSPPNRPLELARIDNSGERVQRGQKEGGGISGPNFLTTHRITGTCVAPPIPPWFHPHRAERDDRQMPRGCPVGGDSSCQTERALAGYPWRAVGETTT